MEMKKEDEEKEVGEEKCSNETKALALNYVAKPVINSACWVTRVSRPLHSY